MTNKQDSAPNPSVERSRISSLRVSKLKTYPDSTDHPDFIRGWYLLKRVLKPWLPCPSSSYPPVVFWYVKTLDQFESRQGLVGAPYLI